MNLGLRGDGAVEDVDGDGPPKDGRVVGDDDGDDFPLREGSSPGGIALPEGKSAPAQVPSRDGGASSRKSSPYFVNLAYYERKGIRITPKSIIMHKNIMNNSRKT